MDIEFRAGPNPHALVREASARGLALAAEFVLQRSNEVVPIEEHTLQRSGRTSVDKAGTRAAVTYDTPYAVPVHEDLTARHDAGRHAKYLEGTIAESVEDVRSIIADALRGAL